MIEAETYMTLITDRNHWLFEITSSMVENIVLLLLAAIVWPKIRASVSTLHARFDAEHNLSHQDVDLQAQANAVALAQLTDLANEPHAGNCVCALCHSEGVGAWTGTHWPIAAVLPYQAPAKVRASYDQNERLSHDCLEARIELVSAGAEIPAWLYEDGDHEFYNSFW